MVRDRIIKVNGVRLRLVPKSYYLIMKDKVITAVLRFDEKNHRKTSYFVEVLPLSVV